MTNALFYFIIIVVLLFQAYKDLTLLKWRYETARVRKSAGISRLAIASHILRYVEGELGPTECFAMEQCANGAEMQGVIRRSLRGFEPYNPLH